MVKGNQYNYNYQYSDSTNPGGSEQSLEIDSGSVSYLITDATYKESKTVWSVQQKVNFLRHYSFRNIDTLYRFQNTSNFILSESLNGNHELTAAPETWRIWCFPVWDTSIYRYRDTSAIIISSSYNNEDVDSLWFDDVRGLYKRTSDTEYLGNNSIYTHTRIDLTSITSTTLVINDKVSNLPSDISLFQNYPNTFNPNTTIEYSIPAELTVTLKVYDLLGREVTTLVNKEQRAGSYKVNFNATGLANGVYFYSLKAGSYLNVKKLILLK